MRLFRTKRAVPMLGQVLLGLVAVVISQKILVLELDRSVLDGCRRINRNAIFSFNDLSFNDGETKHPELASLPEYCIDALGIDTATTDSLERLILLDQQEYEREKILLYADELSKKQRDKSTLTGRLALGLLLVNVFAMSLEALKLDYENIEIDE